MIQIDARLTKISKAYSVLLKAILFNIIGNRSCRFKPFVNHYYIIQSYGCYQEVSYLALITNYKKSNVFV